MFGRLPSGDRQGNAHRAIPIDQFPPVCGRFRAVMRQAPDGQDAGPVADVVEHVDIGIARKEAERLAPAV